MFAPYLNGQVIPVKTLRRDYKDFYRGANNRPVSRYLNLAVVCSRSQISNVSLAEPGNAVAGGGAFVMPWRGKNPLADVFVVKALSRVPLRRDNGAMKLQLVRNIWEPTELVRFLVTANIVLFVTSLFIAPRFVNYDLNPMVFLSPGTGVLFKLGASGTLPVFAEDRWWTLITANYLHGSLLHLLFNVFALRAVGKINIEIYAPGRLFLIYFLGGIFSMAVSSLAGIPLTLGASGAICALIGSMSYDQWRASKGDLKRRIASIGIWVALIVFTGLALPNVNNWAHAAGFVGGFLLGFLLWPKTAERESKSIRVAAIGSMLITIGVLIYGLLFS